MFVGCFAGRWSTLRGVESTERCEVRGEVLDLVESLGDVGSGTEEVEGERLGLADEEVFLGEMGKVVRERERRLGVFGLVSHLDLLHDLVVVSRSLAQESASEISYHMAVNERMYFRLFGGGGKDTN